MSFKQQLINLEKEYPIKNREYWVKYGKLQEELTTRLKEIDPTIFPDKLF